MKTAIHEKICTLRKAKGLTQEQLGAKLGISGQAVSKWEKGETLPDILLLPDLCKILGISADELLELPQAEKGTGPLIAVKNEMGFSFEMKGYAHRQACMKLNYEDVANYLSVLNNELTYRVLVQIPFIEDEFITPEQIAAATGFSDDDVNKALRILKKRKLISEVSDMLEDAGLAEDDGVSKYWQNDAGMIGSYMILSGCMNSSTLANESSQMETTTKEIIRNNPDGTHTVVNTIVSSIINPD